MLTLFDGKVCVKCGHWKPFDRYSPSPTTKDRLKSLCKECNAVEAREWHKNNRDRHVARCKANYLAKSDEYKQRTRDWRTNNRDRRNANERKWRFLNRERLSITGSQWRRKWYRDNRIHAIGKVHQRRMRLLSSGGRFTEQEWRDMCEQCQGRCLCCGEVKQLTVDHIIPVTQGGRHEAANIQPLCQSCNSRKGARTIDYRYNVAENAAFVEWL